MTRQRLQNSALSVVVFSHIALLVTGIVLLMPSQAFASRPVLERVIPTSAPPGATVDIIGRHVPDGAKIVLGETELPPVKQRPGRWTVQIPDGASSGDLAVRVGKEVFPGPYLRIVHGNPRPSMSKVVPAAAPPGTVVRIVGDGFAIRLEDNKVRVGDVPLIVQQSSPSELHVLVPPGTPAKSDVISASVEHGSFREGPKFEVLPPLTIEKFKEPVVAHGALVEILGTGFVGSTRELKVRAGGRTLAVKSVSPTKVVALAPRSDLLGRVTVETRFGAVESPIELAVRPSPKVSQLDPARIVPGGGVTIKGRGFGEDVRKVKVSVGGQALDVKEVTPTAIRVIVPEGVSTGPVQVSVAGLAPVSARKPLDVLTPLKFVDVEPTAAKPGETIALKAEGLPGRHTELKVELGGKRFTVKKVAPGYALLVVPKMEGHSGALTISAPDRGQVLSNKPFTVLQPPEIKAVSSYKAFFEDKLTISGNNFGDQISELTVTLAGRKMAIESATEQEIIAIVPEGAQSGPIQVAVRLQGSATTDKEIEIVGSGKFRILSLEPECAYPGCEVVFRGTGFAREGERSVRFGDEEVKIKETTPKSMTIVLPKSIGEHPFDVQVGSQTASTAPFRVVARPRF